VGYDAGKKVKGRRRHLVVDTQGSRPECRRPPGEHTGPRWRPPRARRLAQSLPLTRPDLGRWCLQRPWLGRALCQAAALALEVVKRCDDTTSFKVLPRRWVVERTIGWIGRSRRLARDYEGLAETTCTYRFRRRYQPFNPATCPPMRHSRPSPLNRGRGEEQLLSMSRYLHHLIS
jgi:transposase